MEEKNRLVALYRNIADAPKSDAGQAALHTLRDDIQRHRDPANALLDELLLDEFAAFKIRYEQATWDAAKGAEGRPAAH